MDFLVFNFRFLKLMVKHTRGYDVSLKSVVSLFVVTASLIIPVFAGAAAKDDIAARIAPIGELCMAGDECAAAAVEVASGPRSGEDVYSSKCIACHGSGAAGAPKLGDAGDWSARLGKGTDTLYTNAIAGFQGMPAKGLCFDCSDDEIKAAVDYMVSNSQ